jgi:PAS domain S-box-containing protein
MKAAVPTNEAARLEALRRYQVLDTPPEQEFDDLCLLAAHICGTPFAMISLIDQERQWFKSKVGSDVTETPREIAFCAHAILQSDVLVVENAQTDKRFSDNPLVTSDPNLRFYAGTPLITPDGFPIGTICVSDQKPRHLAPEQLEALHALGRAVITQLELRRNLIELTRTTLARQRLEQTVRESERRLFQFLEAVPVGIFIVDSTGSPYYANQTSKRILGKGIAPGATPGEMVEIYKVFVAGTDKEYPVRRTPLTRAVSGETSMIDDMEIHRDGKIIPIQAWGAPIYDENGKIAYAIAAFMDVTSHRWAEKRLYAQYAATKVLSESATLAEAIPKILQAICESVGWQVAGYYQVDKEANVLRCIDMWHVPELDITEFETLTRKLPFPPGFGLGGRVWSSCKPAWIPNVVEDHNFPRTPAALKNGLHAGIGFPIMIEDEVVGVMEFFSKQIHEPDTELLWMLGALGTQIGQFIKRKKAEEKQLSLSKELEDTLAELKTLKSS